MAKLTTTRLKKLLTQPGRHGDGNGLYFRTLGDAKAYWVYRYRIGGKEREISIGRYPEMPLEQARKEHAKLHTQVVNDRIDPLADKHAPKPAAKPSFGEIARSLSE